MALDRIDWHSGADNFPAELPHEAGGINIGMFLAWIINNDLISKEHITESSESLALVKQRKMTGTEFFIKVCDEKFWETDLNNEGLAFAQAYYETNDYFEDYEATLSLNEPTLYHVKDSWS
ncbi:DUF7832 domain-containing protein, partial [Alteromonas gracilis]|uniref:DUF7832 domain-containing protein n=1 Tax=Alteromonas gracilis TaxID=1479524 RepID=UPI0036F3867E